MKLLTTVSAFLFSGILLATPLRDVVVFGDSLSDNGNLYEVMKHKLPPSPPYYLGRFSNGPIWIEYLMASYFPKNPAAHLLDYAYGGAGVSEEVGSEDELFTLKGEINTYLLANQDKASKDSLFIFWIGANNYLAFPSDLEKTLWDVHEGIEHSVKHLVNKGARHILMINLPDLGQAPMAREFGCADVMTYLTKEHNRLLNQSMEHFKEEYPDIEWLHYDLYQDFNEVLEHQSDYGFTNSTSSCIDFVSEARANPSILKMVAAVKPKINRDACDGYLFFDLVHPTSTLHQILSKKARDMLDKAGIQFESDSNS